MYLNYVRATRWNVKLINIRLFPWTENLWASSRPCQTSSRRKPGTSSLPTPDRGRPFRPSRLQSGKSPRDQSSLQSSLSWRFLEWRWCRFALGASRGSALASCRDIWPLWERPGSQELYGPWWPLDRECSFVLKINAFIWWHVLHFLHALWFTWRTQWSICHHFDSHLVQRRLEIFLLKVGGALDLVDWYGNPCRMSETFNLLAIEVWQTHQCSSSFRSPQSAPAPARFQRGPPHLLWWPFREY